MATSEIISGFALFVATCSFGVSWWGAIRDRVSLMLIAKLMNNADGYGQPYIAIKVVNTGRRVAVLTMFGGELADGTWQGTNIGESGRGLHLAESEFHERQVTAMDLVAVSPDSESEYVSFWFEDSHGRRHKIPKSESLIRELATAEAAQVNAARRDTP
jgi:hypothetical protein